MKASRVKTGFFRRLLAAFFSNWGLKLLALALAIIVYHSLKKENASSQDSHDRPILLFR